MNPPPRPPDPAAAARDGAVEPTFVDRSSGASKSAGTGETLPVRSSEATIAAARQPLASEGLPDFRAGTAALAAMPDDEFEVRLVAMRRGRERITRIHRELMDPETDYGVIPGTKQPTLLK